MDDGEIEDGDLKMENGKIDNDIYLLSSTIKKPSSTIYPLSSNKSSTVNSDDYIWEDIMIDKIQKTASDEAVSSGLTRFVNNNEPDLRIDINIPEDEQFVKPQAEKGVDPTGIEPVRPEFLDPAPEPGGPTPSSLSQNSNLFSINPSNRIILGFRN